MRGGGDARAFVQVGCSRHVGGGGTGYQTPCRTQKFSSSSRPLRGRQRAGLAAGPGVRSVFQFGELVVSAVGACGKGFGIARDANDVAAVVAAVASRARLVACLVLHGRLLI